MSEEVLCTFCKSNMVLAWKGNTPTNGILEAWICPKCFSTYYVGNADDPVFQMIEEINKAFAKIYMKLKGKHVT